MSSFDKIVKLACKPKRAPPKAKYLDPIIMATYSDDGSIHDVCKALAPRLREPDAVISFKALIVLHSMIRNGATDNVLSYLSSSDVLRLRNVAQGNWEGYEPPANLIRYAAYLETRVRAYRELKHDAIRVQSESNRDADISRDVEVSSSKKKSSKVDAGPQRSKTMMGRKLRSLAVEKGLLRETKTVQKQMDALLACKFYLDDLEDELTISALRLLVKDLLVLFQAVNEGVINVLEHYFEMSHVDAEEALKIYRHFCKQAEQVVEYLSIAKKMQNLLNVPVPNLKHAPVSLAGALEEYLNDPNFEQNRLEYKANKDIADGKAPAKPVETKSTTAKPASAPSASSASAPTTAAPANQPTKPEMNKELVDFFASIEHGQTDMFNPHTNSPTSVYFAQQAASNPFVHRQSAMVLPQATGAFPGASPFTALQAPFMRAQPTGFPMQMPTTMPHTFLQPVQTGVPSTFQPAQTGLPSAFQLPQTGAPPSAFLQPQQPTGLLQPQPTGANPFRQSMFIPQQNTGMPSMAPPMMPATAPMRSMSAFDSQPSAAQPSMEPKTLSFTNTPFNTSPKAMPQRAASTPLTNPNGTIPAPLVPMKTGSKNPFAPPPGSLPPMPTQPPPPTLNAMRTGVGAWAQPFQQTNGQAAEPPKTNGFASTQGGDMSSIASSFAKTSIGQQGSSATGGQSGGFTPFSPPFGQGSTPQDKSSLSTPFSSNNATLFGSNTSTTPFSTNNSATPFSSNNTTTPFSLGGQDKPQTPLQPQPTGYAGSSVKPFKPSSTFGASLLASLPPISEPGPTSPSTTSPPPSAAQSSFSSMSSQPTGMTNFTGMSGSTQTSFPSSAQSQPTGFPNNTFSGMGMSGGLAPQATGMANPFRASMFNPLSQQQSSPFGAPGGNSGASQNRPFAAAGNTPFNQQGQQQQTTSFGSLI